MMCCARIIQRRFHRDALQLIAASLQLVSNLFPILDNETLSYDIIRSCADYHVWGHVH